MAERKKIAVIITAFFPVAHGSNAHLVASKFAQGFPTSEGVLEPKVDLLVMYIDQPHWTELGSALAREHDIEIYPSICAALMLTPQGRPGHWTPEDDEQPGELAVDGVIIVDEHGDYAGNEQQRHLYRRRYLFEQVCGMFATSGRSLPVFNDKHFSYNWADSLWMYKRAREVKIPFMADSTLPVRSRGPELEHELETPIEEALPIGYIHPFLFGLDSYGFHGLEGLQCLVECRSGGESGIGGPSGALTATRCGRPANKAPGHAIWRRPASSACLRCARSE